MWKRLQQFITWLTKPSVFWNLIFYASVVLFVLSKDPAYMASSLVALLGVQLLEAKYSIAIDLTSNEAINAAIRSSASPAPDPECKPPA